MFNSRVLETAIGLIFVFLLFSTICASVREAIEAFLKTRATYLERGLRELLDDAKGQGLARMLYEHPLIYGLYRGDYPPDGAAAGRARGAILPSYIPSKNFALALMDILARGPAPSTIAPYTGSASGTPASSDGNVITMDTLRAGAHKPGNEAIARAVLSALDVAQGDLDRARQNIEQWYDSTMDRISGWYRRSTHWIVFSMALSLAVALNINSIRIADYLYSNDVPRHNIVDRAGHIAPIDSPPAAPTADTAAARTPSTNAAAPASPAGSATPGTSASRAAAPSDTSTSALLDPTMTLPIGWTYFNRPAIDATWYAQLTFWLALLLGWFITAFAATLGAPFWFDVMNKIMVIRSTVKPHEKSPNEASEDRQQSSISASSLPSAQPFTYAGAPGMVERRQAPQLSYDDPVEVDGCGHADAPQTEDKDLPPAQGGIK